MNQWAQEIKRLVLHSNLNDSSIQVEGENNNGVKK